MAISADLLRMHLEYSRWASARLLKAAGTVSDTELRRDFATAYRSVIGTLAHVYGGDRVWLARVRGDAPQVLPGEEFHDLERLLPAWQAVSDGWLEWARPLTDEDCLRGLSYRDLKGNPWVTPLWQVVMHVVNHATHHRGQVAGFLRAMGHQPPSLDLIAYYRTRTAASGRGSE
jgi:uncharacterized damage-inducible protein DinB